MKPKHQRLAFIAISLVFLCAATIISLRAFRDNLVFFYSPSELAEKSPPPGQRLRIGGLVESGSISHGENNLVRFRLGDGKTAIAVEYHGLPPALFREGQGAVVEGHYDGSIFLAAQLLTKHDEYYMPREVVEALKASGRWKEGSAP